MSDSSGSPLTALRQQAEQALQDAWEDGFEDEHVREAESAWRHSVICTSLAQQTHPFVQRLLAYSGELRTAIFDLLAELSRQAEEAAGSEEAFRIQGQELLHHIRECERLTAELARLQGGGYVQHLPTCRLSKTLLGTSQPRVCTCGLSALIDPSRGEPTDQP